MNLLEKSQGLLAGNNSNQHRWGAVLANCYNFHPQDFEAAGRTASSLARLPKEIERLVRDSPANDFLIPDDCLGWVADVTKALEQLTWSLNSSAKSHIDAIRKHHAPMIKICGGIIDKYMAEREIDHDKVKHVLTDLRKLISDVRRLEESDIPEQVKRFVLSQLDILERALVDCRLMGRDAIYNALADTVGRFKFHHKTTEQVKKTKVWPKVQGALSAFVLLGTAYALAKEIGMDIEDYLPEGFVHAVENEAEGEPPLIEKAK